MNSDIIKEWRKRKAQADLINNNKKFHNIWRSFMFTKKGKLAGHDKTWDKYENFYKDMHDSYLDGMRLIRKDKNKPFCKSNCIWCTDEESAMLKRNTVRIEYNGLNLTFKQWSTITKCSASAIKNRYYKHNDWPVKDILFGKRIIRNKKLPKDWRENPNYIRQKASKMISAYKHKDLVKNMPICDIDIDWMIDNILTKPCIYCGDKKRIGCDRIDNTKGHTKDNVVPCCYECNCARNNNFSFEEMKIIGEAIRKIKQNREIV